MQSVRVKLICFPRDEIKKYDKRYKLLRPQFSRVQRRLQHLFVFIKAHLLVKPQRTMLYEFVSAILVGNFEAINIILLLLRTK